MATLLYGPDKTDSKGASGFITRLLHGVTAVHMHHLTTDSYAKHKALGELYEGLQGAADTLAEAFMGCSSQVLAFGGGAFEIGADPIADVRKLYEYIEGNRLAMGLESHIQNEVDNVCNLLASALYKLNRLA